MTNRLSNDVFVSYRRDVSQYLAMALWQNLTARDIDVFYDLETIHAGQFEPVILAQIAARPYMVPVLQAGALNRCLNPDDWLRREIEAAIDQDRMLVPVFTPGFDLGDIDKFLPAETAQTLRRFNMLEIPPKYFKYAIQELAENYLKPIKRRLTPPPTAAAAAANRQAEVAKRAARVTSKALSAEEWFARAYEAIEFRDWRGAVEKYTEGIRLDPSSAAPFYNRGNARRNQGDPEGAVADYTEAIRRDPSSAATFNNRGNGYLDMRDLAGAIQDFTEAIRLDPSSAAPFYNRGLVHRELGNLAGAIQDFTEAIRLDPSHERARKRRERAIDAQLAALEEESRSGP